ncbi:MAG: phosphoribosyltransferase family protein [Flavobacteriales bacterium]
MIRHPRLAPREVKADLSDFDAGTYSRLKYGDTTPAAGYAREIRDHCLQDLMDTKVDVVFSPNTFLPTAAHSIASALLRILGDDRCDVQKVHVDRKTTYTRDYGKMDAKERASMISGDSYAFRTPPRPDATLVFVDDVSITGTHQMILENLMDKDGVGQPQRHVYYGVKRDDSIPASIESTLNQFAISSPPDILPLMKEPGFVLNTRATKRLLAFDGFEALLPDIPSHIADALREGAIRNGYGDITDYAKNMAVLEGLPVQR